MISVVMPVYNADRFLRNTIMSILNQTEEDFELIIINDGSTDNSEEIILSFSDKRIKYIYQTNEGAAAAKNNGLRLATGKFITFHDSDDISLPFRFEMLVKHVSTVQAGYIHSDVLLINESDSPIGYWASSNIESSRCLRFFLKVGTPFNNPSILFRREVLEYLEFDTTLVVGEDTDLVSRISNKVISVHIPQPLLLYRRYANSLSRQGSYEVHALHIHKFLNRHSLQQLFPELSWRVEYEADSAARANALLALFLARRALHAEVQKYYENASSSRVTKDTGYFVAAIGNMINGNHAIALELLENCSNRDHIIENYIGEAETLLGRSTIAQVHFLRALQLRPSYIEAVDNLKALGGSQGLNLIDPTWRKYWAVK